MTMPIQKPGKSIQTYGTPIALFNAVEKLIGEKFVWDLAASIQNRKVDNFYSEEQDSLSQDWSQHNGWLWLNPPYAKIGDWAEKCAEESLTGAKICMLVPASVGSNWYAEFVHNKALVLGLRPRITFEGCKDPYPKDCILIIYGLPKVGFDLWKWDE